MIINADVPILEYKEYRHTLFIDEKRIYIKPDKNYWLFPGIPRKINVGLQLWIPNNCIGLLNKSNCLGLNVQLDTKVIHNIDGISMPFIEVVNRGWIPIKLDNNAIIAELSIIPKKECYIVNTEGQS
jgi:hypothetical protein